MNINERKSVSVVPLSLELDVHLYQKLDYYSKDFGWNKRRIIEDALFAWFFQRDNENKKRRETQ